MNEAVWYTAGAWGLAAKGETVPDGNEPLAVADSHRLVVACSRFTPSRPVTYYRVRPLAEPVPIGAVPGLALCGGSAEVQEIVSDGSEWSDEELWPLVKEMRWPDGSPMYVEDGHISEPPYVPSHDDARRLVEELKAERYVLPMLVITRLATISGGWSGRGWPPYAG